MNLRIVLASALAVAFAAPTSAATLKMLPDWFANETVRSIWMMPDGNTFTGIDGEDVFQWSAASGRTNVGALPSTISSGLRAAPIRATAISDNGSTIIGYLGEDPFKPVGGFMWSAEAGVVVMPPLAGSSFSAIPKALSSDGSVIVGNEYVPYFPYPWGLPAPPVQRSKAFRWTAPTGTVGIDGVEYANSVSDDGSVVVGSGPIDEEIVGVGHIEEEWPSSQAVRWTQSTGAIGLGLMPNSDLPLSSASFVSADGATIVGTGSGPHGPRMFRWTEATGMQHLDTVGDDQTPRAISDDANVIVGYMRTWPHDSPGPTAMDQFIWTPDAGLRKLRDAFPPLNSIPVYWMYEVSADGRKIFGDALYTEYDDDYLPIAFHHEYWLLDISPVPEPLTQHLCIFSVLMLLIGRPSNFPKTNYRNWPPLSL